MARLARRVGVLAASFAVVASVHAIAATQAGGTVSVIVEYTGKGTVDAQHQLWVWLFDHPEPGPDSEPLAEQSISKNGGTVTFSVTAKQVYIAAAYDEQGGFAGQAPPPSGSPIALYGQKGPQDKAQPVTPGAKAAVKVAFSDAQRMP